jgi:PAS domain S-box-containing protein
LARKRAKSGTRGRKLHVTRASPRVGRARKTRADLERELKACRRETADARERLVQATKQQAATAEMLRIISNSPIQSVLDAVAENAARLSDANNAEIFRLENNLLRLVASYGEIPVVIHAYQGVRADRETVTGRAACDRRTIHVHDLAAEEDEYPVGSGNAKREGHRTTLGTPLLREDHPIGIILVRRREVRPFSDQQIALIETFAAQAVIAIENARLFETEKQRALALAQANRDLAEREAKIRRLVDANIIGIFIWDFDGRILDANDAFLRMVDYDREDLVSGRIRWAELTPPDWRDPNNSRIAAHKSSGHFPAYEKEYTRKDGTRVPVLMGGATFEEGGNQGMAYVLDLTERKRAEQALRESEAKFRDYAETASDWFWEIGPDYKFTLLTENAFGSDPAARIGATCWDHALDLETEPEKWRLVRETLDARKPFRDFVYCAAGGSGLPMFVRASGKPVFGANGEFRGYRGTGTDVTERMRAEEALRESEYKLRQIIETVPGFLWSTGPDGEITYVNQRILDYSGMRFEDFLRLGWKEYLHPDDFSETEKAFSHAIRTGSSYQTVHRQRRADGEYRWYQVRGEPLRDRHGRIIQWYGLSIDIDEGKKAEERLRASEERWRTVFQNAPVGIATLNPDGRFVTANPTFQRMLGYGEDELRSLTGVDITHEDDRAATRRLIGEMMTGGRQSYQIEKRYRRKDGQVIWVLVNTSIIPASGSTPAFFAGVVVDMTERKRAQEERERLHQLEADLAHMNRVSMMGELAASLAHEITQPIGSAGNNARAALNFLDQRPPDLGEVREALGCVVSDADRAGDIIDRIREHIKKAPPRKGRFDLNAAINEVTVLAHSAIIENRVSVETRLADGLFPVQGDRVQLQQVVLNLVLNAVEAMGSVEAGARELAISTEQHGTGVLVAVRDSGPGIDAKHRERVFEAFYTTKSSGTGMGLSICRSIIDAHGGRLWAEANEPRGAVFEFTLPGVEASS